ncbi:cysteine sulfinic acid decarboxylase-like [Macrobrachium nipponense]|uniref:cysteine sulfinic acid decarboxylase-like n=1 Tax=Macrobrachium nipponense TaxID=159736 RepID=UPI0030C8475F
MTVGEAAGTQSLLGWNQGPGMTVGEVAGTQSLLGWNQGPGMTVGEAAGTQSFLGQNHGPGITVDFVSRRKRTSRKKMAPVVNQSELKKQRLMMIGSEQNGSVNPLNGSVNPQNGSVIQKNGSISPQKGSVDPQNGSIEGGELLKTILNVVLKERLVTGIDRRQKVVDFKLPAELESLLDLTIRREGHPLKEADSLVGDVVSHSVKTQHPYFFNQLYGGIGEEALAGAWLVEALNTNQYTFEVAPVFIVVERYVIGELISLFGWGAGDGIFAPGGSISNMYAMAVARYRQNPEVKCKGVFGMKPLVAFTSDQSHYSITKSAHWLGLGLDNVVTVPTDDQGRMTPSALKSAIARVRSEGREPFFVNATAGSTVLGAYDPLGALAEVCEEEGVWLHVDACWGGSAIVSRKHKHLLDGINRADSLSWNPHKMLGASLQCSVFLTKHKGLLHECNSARATYLFQQDKHYDASYDSGDKSVQCGRKTDAFKLWFLLKLQGLDATEAKVDQVFELSREVRSRPGFRLIAEPQCTNVCFWYVPPSLRGQEETGEWWIKVSKVAPEVKKRMVLEGSLMVGYQPLANKRLVNFFRMVLTCGGQVRTRADMDHALDEIERLGADL